MPPALRGIEWSQLSLADVDAMLAESTEETLFWEAKADGKQPLHPHDIKKAVCGFANSERGGYLIIGARKEPGSEAYSLRSLEDPPDEIGAWVDQIVRTGGVTPAPEMTPRTWVERPGVAIIAIEPVAVPPAITDNGAIYIRTSGRTPPVTDPRELARLFAAGEAARTSGRRLAQRAARSMLSDPGRAAAEYVMLGLGLAAHHRAPDRSAGIFSEGFANQIQSFANGLRLGPFYPRVPYPEMSQGAVSVHVEGHHDKGRVLRASWDGSASVAITLEEPMSSLIDLIGRPDAIKVAHEAARQSLLALGDRGSAHLVLMVNVQPRPLMVERLVDLDDDPSVHLESIMREIKRANGETVFEPG